MDIVFVSKTHNGDGSLLEYLRSPVGFVQREYSCIIKEEGIEADYLAS